MSNYLLKHPADHGNHLRLACDCRAHSGFVYIARFTNGQYKIGSTMRSVKKRLKNNRFYEPGDFVHAVLTICCRSLETFLHFQFRDTNVETKGQTEVFALKLCELEWIKSIRSVNGRPVCHFRELEAATMHPPTIDFCQDTRGYSDYL